MFRSDLGDTDRSCQFPQFLWTCFFPELYGSMNFIENEIKGLHPDILIAGVNRSIHEIYNYTERLLKLTNYPKIVLPTHWDSYEEYEDLNAHEKARNEKVEPFIKEVSGVSKDIQVIVPVHLETIIIN